MTSADLQQLNQLTDLLIRILHSLQLNIEVLQQLSQEASRRQPFDDSPAKVDDFQAALRTCLTEHTFLKQHAGLVRDCAERLSVQVGISPSARSQDSCMLIIASSGIL